MRTDTVPSSADALLSAETDENARCGAAELPDGFQPGDTLARAVRRQDEPMRADRDYVRCGNVEIAVAVGARDAL